MRKRSKEISKKYIFITGIVFALFFMTNTIIGNARNAEDKECYKYYKNVVMQVGGSIFDYADEYADTDHYPTHEEYVREVMFMNHIDDLTQVRPGDYIIIPYYSDILQ